MKTPLTPIAGLFNRWSVFHAGAGLVLAKIFQKMGYDIITVLALVFLVAVLWELFEVVVDGTARTYGTKTAWAVDTALDIALALVFGGIGIM